MLSEVTHDAKVAQAHILKEDGNDLVKKGNKTEALKKYEKGIRLLGLVNYCLDEDGQRALGALDDECRELASILASNAAQMYMDPNARQMGKAIERCNLAVAINPNNAKAYFRRAAAAHDHSDNLAKGADALLAQAQKDVRRFLQLDEGSPAGQNLQEKLNRKRQALQGPIMRSRVHAEAHVEPEWYRAVEQRAIFVCLCGSTATGRDAIDLPDALLSMALHARDKKAISVGVAYVGNKGPDTLEMFGEEWQKKYFRMLRLGERAVKVPAPRQVVVHGEVYNVWSLLEGRVRVMRVNENRKNGERVGIAWMRYCSQLLWHGEPFVYQTCRSYIRFAPKWDVQLKNDLAIAMRRSQNKPVLSWMSRSHEDEEWQWKSERIDYDDNNKCATGTLAAVSFDENFGWVRFRRRFFSHPFGVPPQVAFFSPHNAFSTSDILRDVPADPFLNSLKLHGQLTAENVRLHTHAWDVLSPTVNVTWETSHDAYEANGRLSGAIAEPYCRDKGADPDRFDEQKVRVDALLNVWNNDLIPLDEEMLDLPVPTGCFWTSTRPQDPSPWETGRETGHRFRKAGKRTITAFERFTSIDFTKQDLGERALNAGLNGDRDFEDSKAEMAKRDAQLHRTLGR